MELRCPTITKGRFDQTDHIAFSGGTNISDSIGFLKINANGDKIAAYTEDGVNPIFVADYAASAPTFKGFTIIHSGNSTTNLSEGSNLYFTDERAQDAIGAALVDSSTIDFTYDDAANTITAIVKDNSLSVGKLTFTATDKIAGRASAGAGAGEEITFTSIARQIADDTSFAAVRNTISASWGIIRAETRALINAFTTEPTRTRTFLIDDLIAGLVADGTWAKIDILYLLAAADSQAAKINWKNPGTYTITENGTITFTVDRGYQSDGSTGFLNTNFNPLTNGVNLTQNSASFGIWSRTSGQNNNNDAGNSTILIRARTTADQIAFRVSDNTLSTVAGSTDGSQLISIVRPDSATKRAFRNGTQIGSDVALASAANTSANLYLCGVNAGTFSSRQQAAAFAGSALTATELGNIATRFQAYMTGVGA